MTHLVPSDKSELRDDILVSICFGDLSASKEAFETVRTLAEKIDERFRFREIVIIADVGKHKAYLPLVHKVANVRLLAVHPRTTAYRKRLIAADEAIGDVVLITSEQEIACVDAISMLERAPAEGRAIISLRSEMRVLRKLLSAPIAAIGRAAGFKIGLRDMQTMALPRTLLNQILAHPDPQLAVRFPPRDVRVPLGFSLASNDTRLSAGLSDIERPFALTQKLLAYLAPNLLVVITIASGLLSILGLGYAAYALSVWAILPATEPGWLTISMMLSLTACFLGIAILGLSLGLQQLLALVLKDRLDDVAHEINRVDLFDQVSSELNVDWDKDRHGELT